MSTAGRQPRARFRYLGDPVFLTAVALHLLNRFAIRPFTGDPSDFWHRWFNDLLCVPFWLPPLLWLLRVLGLRRHDAPPTMLELLEMVVLWSAIFEWLVPTTRLAAYFPAAVGDPIDVAMYAAGAAVGGWLWGSGCKGPAIEPPPGPAVGQHLVVAALIVCKTVVGAMLCLVVLAMCPDGTFENARVRLARRSVEDLAAAILAERERTGSLPPSLPDDLAERFPRDAFLYRPDGEQFVVIASAATTRSAERAKPPICGGQRRGSHQHRRGRGSTGWTPPLRSSPARWSACSSPRGGCAIAAVAGRRTNAWTQPPGTRCPTTSSCRSATRCSCCSGNTSS